MSYFLALLFPVLAAVDINSTHTLTLRRIYTSRLFGTFVQERKIVDQITFLNECHKQNREMQMRPQWLRHESDFSIPSQKSARIEVGEMLG